MIESKYPTLKEIRKSHAPKIEYERYLFASRFVFRPPSFPAIWLAIRLGLSSETISWLSGVAALMGFVFLLWPGTPMIYLGIIFLILFNFLDCLDGGIARIMGTRNPYGHFLDSIMSWADMLFWGVIGVLVLRVPELRTIGDSYAIVEEFWFIVGLLSAFFATYAAYLESTFDQVLKKHWETILRQEGEQIAITPIAGKSGVEVFIRTAFHNLRVRETHYLLLPLFCFLGFVDVFLSFFLFLNVVYTFILLFIYCRRGRKIYNADLGRDK
jgi:phosphatidylglycerophosphate synthase